jgi:hypothetical protein
VTVNIAIGDAKELELPFRPAPPPSTKPAPVLVEKTALAEPPKEPVDGGSSQRTLGYVTTGVGIAGLVVGAVSGLIVLDKKATVTDECDDDDVCSKKGKEAADTGKKLATVSTVAFTVGLAGVATGVTLLVTAPDGGRAGAWLAVSGNF